MGLCCCKTDSVRTEEKTSLLQTSLADHSDNYVSIFDDKHPAMPLTTKATTTGDPLAVQDDTDADIEEDTKQDPAITSSTAPSDRHIYEGFIAKFNGTNVTKYYGTLYGTTLNIYAQKPIDNAISKKRNIYDMINISQFHDIDTYTLDDIHYAFGVTFADRCGDFDAEYFMFETEREQNEWHDAFKSVMTIHTDTESEEKKLMTNDSSDVIACEWMVCEYNIYWMALPIHNSELWLYRDNRNNQTDRIHMRINLQNYNKVTVMDNTDDTLFKYGFMLSSTSNPAMQFIAYSKSNHNRSKWVTHCDYIVANKTNPIPCISDAAVDTEVSTVFGDTFLKQETMKNDDPLQRLLLLLECYKKWIQSKVSVPLIWLFQIRLKSNYVSILNDHHLLLLNDKYSASKLKCVDMDQCGCLKRRNRLNMDVDERKSLYFGYVDHPNCVLFQLLDRIHCYMYHHTAVDTFMIDTDCNNFGQDFTYYDEFKDAPHFVKAKYAHLKDELLHNPYHRLDSSDYYDFYLKALYLRRSDYVKRHCVVRDYGMICDIQGMEEDDVLSINHLLCLLLYSQHNTLRKEFSTHCRKNSENESDLQLNERHRFVANWRRYLFETCFIFGDTLDANEFVYSVMDSKQFIFDSLDVIHFVPTSMTADPDASNYGMNDEFMMFKLEKADDRLCRYFDMKFISDTASERLFCGVRLKIKDVTMANKSYATEIAALQLVEVILKGSLFYFEWNQPLYAPQSQLRLVQFIEHYLNEKEDLSCDYFQNVFNKILTRYLDDSFFGICISFQQISELNQDLMEYFVDMNQDDFKGKLFAQNDKINVRFLEQPHVIKAAEAELELIRNNEYLENICFDEFQVINGQNEKFTFYLEIEKQLDEEDESNEEDTEISFNCNLYLKSCPPHIIKAKLFWDFVCTELQFENIEKAVELQRNNCDAIYNAPLCNIESKQNSLTFMINIKVLC